MPTALKNEITNLKKEGFQSNKNINGKQVNKILFPLFGN